jgi:hypothetical protein
MNMSPTNQSRRRILQLATIAVPSLAAGAWLGTSAPGAAWTANGKFRFFSAPDGIHWASADGARSGLFLLLGASFALTPGSVAPRKNHLAYSALDRRTGSNIWTVPFELRSDRPIAGKPRAFFHSGTFDVTPLFSADGQRITYASRAAGKWIMQARSFA